MRGAGRDSERTFRRLQADVCSVEDALRVLYLNPSLEFNPEEAGTTGNTRISLVVGHAEAFFLKAFTYFSL
jgi:hypothetical protein